AVGVVEVVAVGAHVAGIAHAIPVIVELIGVRVPGAVVEASPHAVPVVVVVPLGAAVARTVAVGVVGVVDGARVAAVHRAVAVGVHEIAAARAGVAAVTDPVVILVVEGVEGADVADVAD